ncbi:MAG: FAD-binding oxidoreductase [Pseudomonadota bacterium]
MTKKLPARNADVAIIGGGIIGCSTAYYTAKAGLNVLLVDKGAAGFEQSTRNWGWVHQQVRHPHLIPFAMYSRQLWAGLEAELGQALEWRMGGNLSIASTQTHMAAFEDYQRKAMAAGLETQLLTAEQTQAMLPGVNASVAGALYIDSDGQANPHLATRAFANAAAEAGATIIEGCVANHVLCADNTVQGVATELGEVKAEQVVIAGGAWSRRLLKPLGIKLPQNAIRSTVIRTTPAPQFTQATGWASGTAFRQDVNGQFILAAGAKSTYDVNLDALTDWLSFGSSAWRFRRQLKLSVGKPLLRDLAALIPGTQAHRSIWSALRTNEPPPDLNAAAPNLQGFQQLFPQFENLAVDKIWAGNIDMTPDQAPVLDAQAGIDGLIIATGFSGHGFAMGPGGGHATSLLLQGKTPKPELHGFRLSRFAENDLPEMAEFHP